MMWMTTAPDPRYYQWEPLELRMLKQQLANTNCSCRRSKDIDQQDEEVQVKKHSDISDRFIQVSPSASYSCGRLRCSYDTSSFPHNNVFCPTCYLTLNLLRGAATKVLKDEEIETNIVKDMCNKSTEKIVQSVEKTTSVPNKPVLKYSNISLACGIITDDIHNEGEGSNTSSSEDSNEDITTKPQNKKTGNREVTFLLKEDELPKVPVPQEHNVYISKFRNCLCVDELIESIRPPMSNW